MQTEIKLTIDQQQIVAKPGQTILQVARENNIEIPTLCYDSRLEPYGSCLLCVVEVKGMNKLVLSCTTAVSEGMVVQTNNEKIFKARQSALQLLLSNHFADCRGPCYERCPADVDVQGYLAFARAGKYKEALERIRETNPLPLVCGRVCVRYCEGACRRQEVDSPVAINFIKRYVADLEHDNLDRPQPGESNGHAVAVVGGGPGGLTAAYFLAKRGYKIKIFDAHEKLGGMLRYGIPDYRLPQSVLDKEIAYIIDHGIEVDTNVKLGVDFTLDDLKGQGYEAVFLALGAQKAKAMGIPHEDTPGVVGGIHFLAEVKNQGPPDLKGHVVVVGGGNTAIDAARTALRCNAAKVTILYRRTRDEMPADEVEIEDALAEGVEIEYLVAPLDVIEEGGRVKSLRCQRMKLGEPDASGRRSPIPIEGDIFDVVCNTIIAAIGQDCDVACLQGDGIGAVETTRRQTIVADPASFATNIEGVFAGGDIVSGPAAAADAIGAGRKAAMVIDSYVRAGQVLPPYQEFISKKTNLGEIPASYFDLFDKTDRSRMQQADPLTRITNFNEVDRGIAHDDVNREAQRCLSCGCSDVYLCELKKWAGEYQVNQQAFAGKGNKYRVDDRHPYVLMDPNKCILCGKCVRYCDQLLATSALGFISRGYDMIVRPSMEQPLQNTTCISCGNCIEICPTGAISFNRPPERPWPQHSVPCESVCNFCGVGCNLVFNKKNDVLWNVTAKRQSQYVTGELCMAGRFGHRNIIEANRLTVPKVLENTKQFETNMEYAISHAITGLKEVRDKYGSNALAFLVSPRSTNEEIFMVQRLAREVFGTSNITSLHALARSSEEDDLDDTLGVTASTLSQDQVENADVIVLFNSNVTEDNPVLSFSIKRAARKGATVISISSTELEMNAFASMWLNTRRGTNTLLLKALASQIIEQKAFDEKAVTAIADGFDVFKRAISISPAEAAAATGVSQAHIEQLAGMVSDPDKNIVYVYNMDSILEKSPGDLQALGNLLLLTGKIGREHNGILLTREHSNSQGLIDLGATLKVSHWKHPAASWECAQGARSLSELREAMFSGMIKGFFIVGEDFAVNKDYAKLLDQADFVAVMDMFETETTALANVALPGSAYAEAEGSVTSQDRRVQAFSRVFDPPAGPTGFAILARLYGEATTQDAPNLESVRSDIAVFNPQYKQITQIGGNGSFYWNETEEGGKILFSTGFATGTSKAMFVKMDYIAPATQKQVISFSTIEKIYQDQRYYLLSSRKVIDKAKVPVV